MSDSARMTATADPIPPVPMIAVVITETSSLSIGVRGIGYRRCEGFTGGLGIHSDSPAGVLDGQWAGDQSPSGSVVCPTSIRWPSGSRM